LVVQLNEAIPLLGDVNDSACSLVFGVFRPYGASACERTSFPGAKDGQALVEAPCAQGVLAIGIAANADAFRSGGRNSTATTHSSDPGGDFGR